MGTKRDEDFESMDLDALIESQKRDDNDFVKPERLVSETGRSVDVRGFAEMDYFSRVQNEYGDFRLPMESRPRINGQPGLEDEMSGYIPKLRTGRYRDPHAKGCRTHGFEFWRTPPTSRSYCTECKRTNRKRKEETK